MSRYFHRLGKDWQIQFNIKKCKVMGMGKNNENIDYMNHGVILKRVMQENDLEVVIDTRGKQTADNAR